MATGRNDPCPCGSGKKYKYCCLEKQNSPHPPEVSNDFDAALKQILEEDQFATLEDMQAAMDQIMLQQNRHMLEEFDGLSPEQMHRFLYFPLETPSLVTFADLDADFAIKAPITDLFSMLIEAIGEKGLKATAKGNLPRQFCRDAAAVYFPNAVQRYPIRADKIRLEKDFSKLHYVRIVAELAGLIRKYKGKFIQSKKCRTLLSTQGMPGAYRELFLTYVTQFNWGYCDGYPELNFFQQSFLYTLFLLSKYGDNSQPQQFYEDKFLLAFPSVIEQLPESSYTSLEDTARSCFSWRVLCNFAQFFGLIKLTSVSEKLYGREYSVMKSSLLDQFVRFHI